ncbi:MAG: acetyl-CoA carboxylase carboxyl transferase subunit beta, partial [Acidobacteria bacterium]|nr:acetyl-CoA carboxylase carboxyl transferase subunit beta [Acidobacteriota bacterium]
MAWFRKTKKPRSAASERPRSSVPEGLWVRCGGCREIIYSKELDRNLQICPKCGYHFRIGSRARIRLLLDEDAPVELFGGLLPADPLKFRDRKTYRDRVKDYAKTSGEEEAVVVVEGHLEGVPAIV